jgi:hypothetical protein
VYTALKDGVHFDKISLELSFQSSLISNDPLFLSQLLTRNNSMITSGGKYLNIAVTVTSLLLNIAIRLCALIRYSHSNSN